MYVYAVVLWPGDMPDRHKVGWSKDPSQRLRQYRTSAPRAELVGVWLARSGKHDEYRIHQYLEPYCVDREVFDLCIEDLKEVIENEFCLRPVELP